MIVTPVKTRIFKEGEDLFAFITQHIKKLPEKSVLVVTSKIVALAEGRTAVAKTEKDKETLIRAESDWAINTKLVWLTEKDGILMPSAGIDESNSPDGKLILLPKDSYKSARALRKKLQKHYGVKKLGVLITDSCSAPLRKGVVGRALGYAGFKGLQDYAGTKDLFGRVFEFVKTNMADSLATTAVVMMGEGKEQKPLTLIEKAPVVFTDRVRRGELAISREDDMYKPFFSRARKKK